jgi:rRNA maturation endonuclease Nob1
MKNCIYCGKEVDTESVIDFCDKCGREAFGEKMFKAILENMYNAREKGDLHQGSVSFKADSS